MTACLSFDLAPNLCGWAYVSRERITAGAFALPGVGDDLGALASGLRDNFTLLAARFRPAHVSYEAPILLRHDTLLKLRCTYGLGMVLELLCAVEGVPCAEEDLRSIKKLLTDDQWAEKVHVAAAVERMGVILPGTKDAGRLDAADAVGCGLVTLRKLDPEAADVWLSKLSGALL